MMRNGIAWGAVALVALASSATAFAPSFSHVQLRSASRASVARPLRRATGVTKLSAVVEGADAFAHLAATLPAMQGAGFAEFHQHLSAALPSLHLAGATDMDMSWVADAQQLLADAAAAVAPAADAVADVEEKQPGLFEKFVDVVELALTTLHGGLKSAGVPGAWGISIILFTLFVKGITYPLNYKQMASTIALQELQPKVKAIQARYVNDPQKLNEMTAQLYKDEEVNPLAGCIPTIIQIPVFIGLYRSLLDLAKKDLLEESFLWIPSLQGPVGEYNLATGMPIDASGWLTKGWVDGHPALGWEATLAYLSLPVILVVTQSISQKLLQPPQSEDPAQAQTQQILKFLPLMIGWFSLNVPAGLGVYWVINNGLSTGQQWFIRQQFKNKKPAMAGGGTATMEGVKKASKAPVVVKPSSELGFSSAVSTTATTVVEKVASEDEASEEEEPQSKSSGKKKGKAAKKAKKNN